MLWLFDGASDEKKITKNEFQEQVIPRLRHRGLSEDDVRYVRSILDADLNEKGSQYGIAKEEIMNVVENMRRNAPPSLSKENQTVIEEELLREL